MKCVLALSITCVFACGAAPPRTRISVREYRDKVYAAWLGQCVGNIYGLAHEQKYFAEPGPSNFPLGYTGWGAARLKQLNGAFSDDDTDIEYMYLMAMEKHGVEPTYAQLAAFWLRHVRREVWLANRAAVGAMRYGYTPPWTGKKEVNPHWFQIDPQLVNEIWSITAPGMVRYAAAKSAWAARIMSDDWAVQPAAHYGAMYSAAFFETDIRKLIESGKAALPPGARFVQTVDDMIALHRKHPGDWKAARKESLQKLYLQEPQSTRTGTNANLNGALGILALLYGGGDFQRTLDIACALGFDADNQAATMAGLLGIVHGTRGIPDSLLYPLKDRHWDAPLNDKYTNVTREGLPDAGLKDIARRLAIQGEKIVLAHHGRKVMESGEEYYEVNPDAEFHPPFEFPAGPPPEIELGKPVNHQLLLSGARKGDVRWRIVKGRLPQGLALTNGAITGVTEDHTGFYPVTVQARSGSEALQRDMTLLVRGPNLAVKAARVLAPVPVADLSLRKLLNIDTPPTTFSGSPEVIRDGRRTGEGATFLSLGAGFTPRTDAYGYEWRQPQIIGLLAFSTGFIEETSGWFTALNIEYQDANGAWVPVKDFQCNPPFSDGNDPVAKTHFAEYLLSFAPIETRAIRISGPVGSAGKNQPLFTSISELGVYSPLPGGAPAR
ncbi:MAG: ADP-ribosylglycohydrolase family protein [Bryobacterales bacterium]|nr:ADP-ribosylglycohydrolase family protein [Bryobacterales bacterium]